MSRGQEDQELPSMVEYLDLQSHNSGLTSYSSILSEGSRTGDSFNGFDHQQAIHINNADKADMLNQMLEFDSVQKRLDTFIRWPVDNPIEPAHLAAAGFYSLGVDDRVVCFKCDLHLRQWKAGDDPWIEHKRFRPRCPFVLDCESERDFGVTCSPMEASYSQNSAQISLTQDSPTYANPVRPEERRENHYVREFSGPGVSPYRDPERPQFVTQGGVRYEQSFNGRPVDSQTGYRDQHGYHTGRMQQFPGKDPRFMPFQRPEPQRPGAEVTKHVVVGQGSSQVHIVGSAATVYRLNSEDKLYIHSGQGPPQQARPVFTEENQTSRLSSKRETSFPGFREASQYRSEDPMSGRYQPPPSTASFLPSYTRQFVKQPGYDERSSSEEKGTVEGGSSFHQLQGGNEEYTVQPYQNTYHKQEALKYSTNTLHKTSISKQISFPQEASPGQMYHEPHSMERRVSNPQEAPPGQMYHEPHLMERRVSNPQEAPPEQMYHEPHSMERRVSNPQEAPPGQMYHEPHSMERRISNEGGLLQENCYRPQRYPGEKLREPSPLQPPREVNRWQDPPGHSAPSRRPTPFSAFPVKDPSLQPPQRLIRHEDARHVTSSSDLASEHHRLTTFVDWPHNHPIRPWDLSSAGFYYLGSSDSVKCFKCGISLHNWDPEDTPWGEHLKWSPRCPMVLEHFRGRPRQLEENAPRQGVISRERHTSPQETIQYGRPEQNHGPNDRQVPIRSNDRPVHGSWSRLEQFPGRVVSNVSRPQNPPLEQQHPQWQTQPMTTSQEEGQVTSGRQSGSIGESGPSQDQRSCSPRGSTALEIDMERLAEMGFTTQQINDAISAQVETTGSNFTSYADLVSALLASQARQVTNQTCEPATQERCQSASPPPPLMLPSEIPAPRRRENQDFEGRNCVSAVTSPTTPLPDINGLRRSLSEPAPRSSESGEESLEEKLERMQEERMCKICMDAEVSVVFLPCGHLSCCAVCANGMDFCPMCRAPIHEKVRTYLS